MAVAKKAVVKKAESVVRTGVDWKSLYLYAVCLITLMVVLFSVISFISGLMGSFLPDPAYIDPYATPAVKPNVAALAQQESYEQRRAIKSMLQSLITFAVATPLYLYHWRQTKRVD
ncbi:MAG: hypothetical protein O3A27_04515 [Actinomycetota bacterium]|nr:hypothetical protein [Actinomycetota bacterium]